MIKFRCNKLGRDKGLKDFKAENITPHYRILEGKEWCQALKHKLIEEAEEVQNSLKVDEIITELADVLEVIEGLCKAYNIDLNQLAQIKEKKYKERGGFEQGFYLESVEMEENNPKIKHFRASPDKYPQI